MKEETIERKAQKLQAKLSQHDPMQVASQIGYSIMRAFGAGFVVGVGVGVLLAYLVYLLTAA